MMAAVRKDEIIGAWEARFDARRGKTGFQVVYRTSLGTAHAGDLRKPWRIPSDAVKTAGVVSKIAAVSIEVPRAHPLLTCDDKTLAEAFERLVEEPAFTKIVLTKWEFELAANAPSVFIKWGEFTWKQRKYLREIVKKIVVER